jgi:hypothetical protein
MLAAMRRVALILACLLVAACARPLTQGERAFAALTHGDSLRLDRIRLHDGALVGSYTWVRPPRPRTTCRERIWPPGEVGEPVEVSPGAIALFNRIFYRRDLYAPDFMPGFPDRLYLAEAMLLAHELTHVWQWQHRDRTGYHPFRAAAEHVRSDDPYLFEEQTADFLSFGFEQQGAIMEEYVCCAVLDPAAPRTARLRAMLAEEIPMGDLDAALGTSEVVIPWAGAETEGICRA